MLNIEKQTLLNLLNSQILAECGLTNPDIDKIKKLLTDGADVNADNGINHQTILMISLDKQHLLVAEVLINAGADINLTDGLGRSAIVGAARDGNLEAVRFLLKHGADHSLTSNQGNSALMLSIVNGEHEVAELLIQSGADIEQSDGKGNTPLMIAASGGLEKFNLIKLLIDLGANPLAKNANGQTPMLKALEYEAKNTLSAGSVLIGANNKLAITKNPSNRPIIQFLEVCVEHQQICNEVKAAQPITQSRPIKARF